MTSNWTSEFLNETNGMWLFTKAHINTAYILTKQIFPSVEICLKQSPIWHPFLFYSKVQQHTCTCRFTRTSKRRAKIQKSINLVKKKIYIYCSCSFLCSNYRLIFYCILNTSFHFDGYLIIQYSIRSLEKCIYSDLKSVIFFIYIISMQMNINNS